MNLGRAVVTSPSVCMYKFHVVEGKPVLKIRLISHWVTRLACRLTNLSMDDLIKKGMIELIEMVPIKQPKKIF